MSIKQKHIFSTITDDDWKHGIKAARERRKGAKKRIYGDMEAILALVSSFQALGNAWDDSATISKDTGFRMRCIARAEIYEYCATELAKLIVLPLNAAKKAKD
jgi:hypothetical protein